MGLAQNPVMGSAVRRPARYAVPVAAAVCICLALTVMAGWWLDLPHVREVVPGFVTMKMNVAVCFLLGGAALWLHGPESAATAPHSRRRAAARLLAGVCGLIAALTLLQYAAGVNLGIDEVLMADPEHRLREQPGRMSVTTSLCFLLFALALQVPRRGGWAGVLYSFLCSAGLVLGCLVLIGYLYRARALYEPLPATAMALHAAAGVAVLFAGALLARPYVGWVRTCLRPGGIGLILRMLLPALLVLPVLLGWLGLQGLERDLYGARGLLAWFVGVSSLLLIVITLLSARTAAVVEDARRRQERLFSTVLRNSLDAFVMMDESGRVQEWNTQAERVFGWNRSEVLGEDLAALIIPNLHQHARLTGMGAFPGTGEGPMTLERTLVTACRRNGQEFAAELIVVPIEMEGRWSFAGFIRDVSEQLALEEQLRQAQKMDAIGQLTGGIAHDLNNLLTVVIGNLDLLIVQSDERVRGQAVPAMQAAERGAALVHRLLAFSRRQPLAPRAVALNELVGGVRDLLGRTLGEEVEINLSLAPDLWPVYADPGQVENALLNLALNARDAMPGGGRLTIETANARLDADYAARNPEVEPGDYVMLAVSDTGEGMPPDVLERAFEPFFTTKEVGKGSGLGLSMIYGFARQSRGHLKIYSEVGHGTTVRLYLPRQREEANRAGEEAAAHEGSERVPPEQPGAGETILIVEDDEAVRSFVALALERLEYRVLTAADAEQALTMLADRPDIDLLFTDVVIPGGMSGRELGEAARLSHPGIRILYTSGYTQNSIIHQGKLDPGVNFLAKPYKREELAVKLRAVLEEGSARDN